jgi:hypothetical protein
MGIFQDWMERRILSESEFNNPMTTQNFGGNPFVSGLHKLQKGLQGGLVANGNYQGHSVLANQFGLSPEETQEMLRFNIIVRGQDGTNVNTQRLQMFLKQMPGQTPNPRIAPRPEPSIPMPPPPPSTGARNGI